MDEGLMAISIVFDGFTVSTVVIPTDDCYRQQIVLKLIIFARKKLCSVVDKKKKEKINDLFPSKYDNNIILF